ncbi:2OG-Fe(II) oxygenase [Sphingomonas sp. CBMAI 2297]|uniref:2OG-Fe(II) oxygenase n=1 Tax=Sphingomonas sp. CBMAI 2297 TaxID=2991720 RepID=UPI002456C0CA|nr:2OG-Fe(II) oxygenase [Sphingomonas sp. CBMAI 2297]MDH4744513.1 2OG-Fe(II) oxygenase [Sphingomonas sp. CBMAI 2297]
MSEPDLSATLQRHGLAELLAHHAAIASDLPDPAGDKVTVAAARWLKQWTGDPRAPAATIEDWAHPAPVLTCDEFLGPGEISALVDFVLSREADFGVGTLVGNERPDIYVDRSFRAAETLFDLGPFLALFERRIERYLPFVCDHLGWPPFEQHGFEFQLTAIRNGGFFRRHNDNSHPATRTRRLTFVFYFFCSPLQPLGGELRFAPRGAWRGPLAFPPIANRMIFFDSSIPHEVLPVRAPTDGFGAARFTVNGWIHQDDR